MTNDAKDATASPPSSSSSNRPITLSDNPPAISRIDRRFTPGRITRQDRNATTDALTQRQGQQGCVERRFQTEGCLPVNGIDVGGGTLSVPFGPGADPTDVYLGSPNGAILNLERVPGTGVLSQLAGSIGCARDDGNMSCLNTSGMGTGEVRQFALSLAGRHLYVPSSLTASGVAILDRSLATGTLTHDPDGNGCISATGNPIAGVKQCLKDARLAGNPESLLISGDGGFGYARRAIA